MILLSNSGEIFEGDMNVISLNLFTSLKSSLLIGPIIIFAPWFFISLTASVSFSLLLKPASLGIIITFLSSISFKANCKEYKSEFPNSSYSPDNGAINPILRILFSSLLETLEFKNNII